MSNIYLVGSLKHPIVPIVARRLRAEGHDVFDDWHGCGPEADLHWRNYERNRGHKFIEALYQPLATHAFEFDRVNMEARDVGILVFPAGKSGHIELGHFIFTPGKRGYILLRDEDPADWDLMYRFATGVFTDMDQLCMALDRDGAGA
jgi:hypothetical protein